MKLANTYGRATDEWIGATADTPCPPHVKLRIFQRYDGRCYLTGRKIRPGDPWELEHIKALKLGGENRESNMAPALVAAHKIKTADDRKILAKVDRLAKKQAGIKPNRRSSFQTNRDGPFKRKMDGTLVRRDAQ